jgi:hypothetical protein
VLLLKWQTPVAWIAPPVEISDKIQANLKDGVLEIRIVKPAERKPEPGHAGFPRDNATDYTSAPSVVNLRLEPDAGLDKERSAQIFVSRSSREDSGSRSTSGILGTQLLADSV